MFKFWPKMFQSWLCRDLQTCGIFEGEKKSAKLLIEKINLEVKNGPVDGMV